VLFGFWLIGKPPHMPRKYSMFVLFPRDFPPPVFSDALGTLLAIYIAYRSHLIRSGTMIKIICYIGIAGMTCGVYLLIMDAVRWLLKATEKERLYRSARKERKRLKTLGGSLQSTGAIS